MPRDSTATRARILDAATAEFSAYGLAGARVDRIAERAGANKQLIYAYFGSKEGLFDATMALHVAELLDVVPFTAEDLPGYAVALYDFATTHPELVRLLGWHTLERPGALAQMEQAVGSTRAKLAALTAAQAAGTVDGTLPPAELLAAVLALARPGDDPPPASPAVRRAAIADAVRRLVTPAPARTPTRPHSGRARDHA